MTKSSATAMYVKAFIAGLAFPATILPVFYLVLYLVGHSSVRNLPLQFMPLFSPMLFGLWNVLYFVIGKRCPVKNRHSRLWTTGASLGFLAALLGVFVIKLPELLFGFTGILNYLPLITAPIIYGLIWRYIVSYLNEVVGLKDW